MEFIKRFRTKPREVKNRYALLLALVVTLFIASFWVFSIPARLAQITQFTTGNSGTGGEQGLFSDLLNQVESQLGSALESVEQSAPSSTSAAMEFRALESLGGGAATATSDIPVTDTQVATRTTDTATAPPDATPFKPKETSTSTPETATGATSTEKKPQTVLIGTSTKPSVNEP